MTPFHSGRHAGPSPLASLVLVVGCVAGLFCGPTASELQAADPASDRAATPVAATEAPLATGRAAGSGPEAAIPGSSGTAASMAPSGSEGLVLKIKAGKLQVKSLGAGQPWRDATDGQTLAFGEVLRTEGDFSGALEYVDGTQLTLQPSTMLQVLSDGLRLYRGAAWIKVIKRGRGFTCIMPSAIASVRGTSFSCEVPSITRLFLERYRSAFFDPAHLAHAPRAQLVSASIGIAVLCRLISEAPGGRVPVAVNVFEGKVLVMHQPAVAPAPAAGVLATPSGTWMLGAGDRVSTLEGAQAKKTELVTADYGRWGLPAPAGLPAARTDDLPGSSDAVLRPTDADGHPIQLMDQPYMH